MSDHPSHYYLPQPSKWPIIASAGACCLLVGAANWLHDNVIGPYLFLAGALTIIYMMFGWFGTVIKENRSGLLSDQQVNRSFRWGMAWFIFSEVMFFGAFFGTLFYARNYSVPWLGGVGHGDLTHILLWPAFKDAWPVFHNPSTSFYVGPRSVMETWGIPAINTLILLSSGGTITVAHWAVLNNQRRKMIIAQACTVLLGITFLLMQAHEYGLAYTEKGLKLASGIFGTTFFMLTGFHAMHVTIGTICLIAILYRMFRGDFNSHDHFGFEAVSWYWHFVDVVWLGLFIFVYWM